mmetsp:Transcript_42696/g.100446  ORF Transcript_42696/g.100446 Transcript_42696/m.100446 type:complete len:402 (+) Transcript_42696:60-1265(+)
MTFYSVVTLWYSALLLQRICSRLPELGTYGDVAFAAGGRHMLHLVFGVQAASYFLLGALNLDLASQYVQLATANISATLTGVTHCQQVWLLFVFAGFLCLAQIPTFSEMLWVTLASVGSLFIVQVVVFYNFSTFDIHKDGSGAPGNTYTGQNFSEILSGTANLAFAYSLHSSLPEQMREFKQPHRFNRCLHIVFLMAGTVYTITGIWGFWALGRFPLPRKTVSGNIFQNFDPTTVPTIIGNVVSFTSIVGACVINNILLFMNLEIKLGVDPKSWMSNKRFGVPPVVFRALFRSLLLGLQLAVAQALGDNVGDLQGIVGSIMSASMAFGLPFLFYWRLFPEEMTPIRKVAFGVQMVLAVFLGCAGLYGAGSNLGKALSGFKAFAWCGPVCATARVPGCPSSA